MAARFDRDGISFSYPENWKMEPEDNAGGWAVTLQSPDTAFLLLSHYDDMPETEEVARTTLEAMQTEYPDLESDAVVESLAGQPAIGHDIRFFSLDLTNTCWSRCFVGPRGTVLLMWQANDLELAKNGPILQAICASLAVVED